MRREAASPGFVAAAVLGIGLLLAIPLLLPVYVVFSLAVFAVMATLALSLGLVWGYGGILSFGQAAFFGLGGYAYAIAAMNFGGSTPGLAAAVLVPVLFAAVVGYFAFYGRVSDVYFGVITLVLSLIIFNAVNSTSGAQYRLGKAPLGGYNGIPSVPPINLPFDAASQVSFEGMFYLAGAVLLAAYLGLRLLTRSAFGRVVVSIRENELRAELLGYDVRRYKLAVFCAGAALAGLAGALFAAWGSFIGPDVFSIGFAAQVIIWVLLGGLGTLLGPILGCMLVQAATTWLGQTKLADPNIVLGVLFIAAVLLVPRGLVPLALAAARHGARRLRGRRP